MRHEGFGSLKLLTGMIRWLLYVAPDAGCPAQRSGAPDRRGIRIRGVGAAPLRSFEFCASSRSHPFPIRARGP